MLRQSDITAAFRESVLRSSKGFQYLHTRDFVTALRRRGIHFTEVEANSWIAREQTYFVDKTPGLSETRPVAPTQKYIGTSASFPIACAGKFYRCRKDALTATTQTAAQILPADFSSVGSRFS